jgi:hypothetical protein
MKCPNIYKISPSLLRTLLFPGIKTCAQLKCSGGGRRCSEWLRNLGARIRNDNEDRENRSLWKLLEDKKEPNSGKQGLMRYVEVPYSREDYVRRHPGGTLNVPKRREAEKRRHESGVDADTLTSPIGKGNNDLSALTATAARKVCVCVCVCVCLRVTGNTPSGKSPADSRTWPVRASTELETKLSHINLHLCTYCK